VFACGVLRAMPLLWLTILFACGGDAAVMVDMALANGATGTVDSRKPEAEAIAVRPDRAIGSTNKIEALVGDATRVIDLDGRLTTPGFIEGHRHYTSLDGSKMILDLTQATIWDEILGMDPKGSLTIGKREDITVLDRNIMTVPEAEIAGTLVDLTIGGGEIRFERRN
jgi:predicted amidohydrolase YtcJ